MQTDKKLKQYFTRQLVNWHQADNNRSLPWKNEKDPYKIWLSEIILQQTRAEQGLPYYHAFIENYPNVAALASASDENVFRLWQGLGYYNRCKNLLVTARYITNELGGVFPQTYEELIRLKGIGSYTGAAIASFAYGLPHAVVDGNVYRVLSRYFGIDTPFDTTEGKKLFTALAGELLYHEDSAAYNQAIMDLGATVCTPQSYNCSNCPLVKGCMALKQDMISLLPVKSKKIKLKTRYFHYILFTAQGKIWIHKRTDNDIWQNLHEFFLIESGKPLDADAITKSDTYKKLRLKPGKFTFSGETKQRLTHQLIQTRFFSQNLETPLLLGDYQGFWIAAEELKNFGFPKTVVSFLEKN